MKARRTIMKKGSFDNYIMGTRAKTLDSKFGVYIRALMLQKQKNPQFKIPVIPGHSTQARTRATKYWAYRNIPTIYKPATVNLQEDESEFYLKTPQEMSRYELAELEADLRQMAEGGEEEEELTPAQEEEMKKDPMYPKMLEKMKNLMKLRHGVIKSYFEKNKYRKTSRNEIIAAAESSEVAIEEVMGKDHVHFLDAHPEIREFMD